MNPLLKRQLAKHLPGINSPVLDPLLDVVSRSYDHYRDQIQILQNAMRLSSDELFEANEKLRTETAMLKDLNTDLNSILFSMKLAAQDPDNDNFNPAEYIRRQTEEIVKASAQREELLKDLAKQNQELNDYAHMVSHDLKAPLRTINTLIAWMIEDNSATLDQNIMKSLNMILFNTEKMDLLIKGILDYSSVDRDNADDRPVDFNTLLEELLITISIPENISIKIAPNLPSITGNYYRFRQLLQNLIENAVKYNDKEKGTIEVGYQEQETDYLFYVKDNGRGIAEAYFEKIFNIFTKLDNNTQSSGIGLSIVKKIIDRYQGRIWPESKEHEGTTFYFTLPK
jgi:light-regulated signal transduction histidine kinase (bacteriophytochrome)